MLNEWRYSEQLTFMDDILSIFNLNMSDIVYLWGRNHKNAN